MRYERLKIKKKNSKENEGHRGISNKLEIVTDRRWCGRNSARRKKNEVVDIPYQQ